PLPGREEDWSFVTEYRVDLLSEAGQWAEAERLQNLRVTWERQRAAAVLAMPPDALGNEQRNTIRLLALPVARMGDILRGMGNPACVAAYEEAVSLCRRIDDMTSVAETLNSLGDAYRWIPVLHDLDKAENNYWLSLAVYEKTDKVGTSTCYRKLGDL